LSVSAARDERQSGIRSFVTTGRAQDHWSPPVARFDRTRALLDEIAEHPNRKAHRRRAGNDPR
jgi:hypothetical protein